MYQIQQIEIFYYVARYRGISNAVRNMPSPVTQPAASRAIKALEERHGCRLLERQPFGLTPEGEGFFGYIRPFFDGLPHALAAIRAPGFRVVNVASTPLILREYFPNILTPLRQRFPDTLFSLLEGSQREIDRYFETREADIIINVLEGQPPPGSGVQPLLEVPIMLVVPNTSPVRSLQDLLKLDRQKLHVLTPPMHDVVTRTFREGLARWPETWVPLIQGTSLELIESYVRSTGGVGLSVDVPGRKLQAGLRAVPLPGFPPMRVGVLWRGPRDNLIEVLLHELKKFAKKL